MVQWLHNLQYLHRIEHMAIHQLRLAELYVYKLFGCMKKQLVHNGLPNNYVYHCDLL